MPNLLVLGLSDLHFWKALVVVASLHLHLDL